jgi:hypothetical protein
MSDLENAKSTTRDELRQAKQRGDEMAAKVRGMDRG